jgi:heme exporter protein C
MKNPDRILLFIVCVMIPVSLYLAFIYAPTEKVMGPVQRIFYFHVASAWTGLLSFFFVFLGGILYLWKKNPIFDRFAYAAAELGVLFCSIVLVTGPIWAKPVWNVWWTWDPRLTSTFVLWLIYVAYLLFRSSLTGHHSVRTYASVYGIIGFVDVPIVYMSIYWWRTIHPRVVTPEKANLDPRMWIAVLVCFGAIMILYTILMRIRMSQEELHERIYAIREKMMELTV